MKWLDLRGAWALALALTLAITLGGCSEKRSHPQPSAEARELGAQMAEWAQSRDSDKPRTF